MRKHLATSKHQEMLKATSGTSSLKTLFRPSPLTALESKKIPWGYVVGFESDTTNMMIGKQNSVLSRVKGKQPGVFSQGCVCHLANLCLLPGIKCLPVEVDDFCGPVLLL